jgi:Lipase (class 3)
MDLTMTPYLMAQACNNIYTIDTGWDHYWVIGGVVIAHQKVGDTDMLVLRGSTTAEDWVRDSEALPMWHPQLGFCHAGFLAGMDDVFSTVKDVVGPRFFITGHSLGGARARLLAALFTVNGLKVDTLCVFGSPKPGFVNIQRIIEKSGMVHLSHRNRNDAVPLLPSILPLWCHTEPWLNVDAAPAIDDFEPLRDHSCALYVRALSVSA